MKARLTATLQRAWNLGPDRWLLGAAALALGVALLRPTVAIERPLFNHVVVLDVTQSMNVQDAVVGGKPVARLDQAKQALRDALLQLPCGSKLGLGLFTEYRSYLLLAPVEVCANLQELRATLGHIDGRMAWTGNSEVAKGLFSGLAIAQQLPDKPALVFVTDGHEAPPLDARNGPRFNQEPGDVPGWIVGVGGLTPLPIPKIDPLGRPLGFWRADEVLHADPRSASRDATPDTAKPQGSEHLSSLREAHLRRLAAETGLKFMRLQESASPGGSPGTSLGAALTEPALARPVPARADLRWLPALLALLLLLARHLLQLRHLRSLRQSAHLSASANPTSA